MDFDIGNILYIVITLVAVIVGLLGKKKKPAEGGSGTPGKEARPGFMENLERMLQMGQESPTVSNLQDYEEDIQLDETVVAETSGQEPVIAGMDRPGIMEEYERIMNRNKDGDFDMVMNEGENMTDTLEVLDLDHEAGTDYFQIVKDFDAGTAVVYSAIINRLDY